MKFFLFSIILALAFVVRVYDVSTIPPGLNRDEAAIGYNAYSLLHTGRDEYGKFLPLSFKSFGDWKLPLYIYADIIPVAIFSLNEFSTRLPSILAGVIEVGVVFFLVHKLFEREYQSTTLGLLAAFLLAISPWHIHFSRVASEANLAVCLVSIGLLLFLYGKERYSYLPWSGLFLVLSMYAYHGNHIFTPLLCLGLCVILYVRKVSIKVWLSFLGVFSVLAAVIFIVTLFSADRTKISGLTPLSDLYSEYAANSVTRTEHPDPRSFDTLLFHNKAVFLLNMFIRGYVNAFSPEFLIFKGGTNLQHNIPNFGNMYIWEFPFMILGLAVLFHKKMEARWLLFYWFLISPLPAAITKDAPHSARMLAFLPLPQILVAIGVFVTVTYCFKFRLNTLIVGVLVVIVFLNVESFFDRYFIHFPVISEAVWGGGYKEIVSYVHDHRSEYTHVLMDRPEFSPYIYFAFYERIDPTVLQTSIERYPEDKEGFQHVKQIAGVTFKQLDWTDDVHRPDTLIISWTEGMPEMATHGIYVVDDAMLERNMDIYGQRFGLQKGDAVGSHLMKIIYLKNEHPQFNIIALRTQQSYAK
jgi:4-amino-4-deoxy-L-arabinose transferase-like glycosyltransferase